MEKAKLNYVIDVLMVILFLVVAISSIILFFFFQMGAGRRGLSNPFGIERHVLVDLHNWSGLVFIALMFVHLLLHFRWFIEMSKHYLNLK